MRARTWCSRVALLGLALSWTLWTLPTSAKPTTDDPTPNQSPDSPSAKPSKPAKKPVPKKEPTVTSKPKPATVIHWTFEDPMVGHPPALQMDGATRVLAAPGTLIPPRPEGNASSLRFDGKSALVKTAVSSKHQALQKNFTWEGFFLLSSSAKVKRDGAVAQRFISQFADNAGGTTRLTIGLTAPRKGKGPVLAVAFGGDKNLSTSKQVVNANGWHHFALVHQGTGTSGTVSYYLDYQKVGQIKLDGKSTRSTLVPSGSASLTLGARLKTGKNVDRGFDGMLDEIRLTSRPLDPKDFLKIQPVPRPVDVTMFEKTLSLESLPADQAADDTWQAEGLAFTQLPQKYSFRGFTTPRYGQQTLFSQTQVKLPPGDYWFMLRTPNNALVTMDGDTLLDGRLPGSKLPFAISKSEPRHYFVRKTLDGKPHDFQLSAQVESQPKKDIGAVVVSYRRGTTGSWKLLGSETDFVVNDHSVSALQGRTGAYFSKLNAKRRQAALAKGKKFWERRHDLARQAVADRVEAQATSDKNLIDIALNAVLAKRHVKAAPLVDDATFIRRLSLDLRGRTPTLDEVKRFLNDDRPHKRDRLIDQMLASSEWADGWMGYWQDVLAENPSILKPTLNNSGPFRFWLHEALKSNMPMDQFVTELTMMEGTDRKRGTAAFALATENDVPMAMKANVLMRSFMAVDMQCARCHDSPLRDLTQKDLFSLAAMLDDDAVAVPKSSVVVVPPGAREPAITISLKPGQKVKPMWTREDLATGRFSSDIVSSPGRPRAELAAILTSFDNQRFAQVMVNRVWKRYMGLGFIEPVDNWTDIDDSASHPALLRKLADQFVYSGYDLKALVKLIVQSDAYQRQVVPFKGSIHEPSNRSFAGQYRRRLTAEQLIDSLIMTAGKPLGQEEQTFDPQRKKGFLNLGVPQRAWQFTSMSNERDRPSLAMPVNQTVVDVMTTFGWRETRPDPITVRDHDPNPLQSLMLSNGLLVNQVIRLSEDSIFTQLSLKDQPVDDLVRDLYLTLLSRVPSKAEREAVAELLKPGYDKRLTGKPPAKVQDRQAVVVDWEKHLDAENNAAAIRAERRVREGDDPTVRLTNDFRLRVEDAVWCLINSPEFVFVP